MSEQEAMKEILFEYCAGEKKACYTQDKKENRVELGGCQS